MNTRKLIKYCLLTSITLVAAGLSAQQRDVSFFNGKDLTGWSASEMKYWSVKDGAIVGHSDKNVPGNKFLWATGEVKDFYLVVEVKLTPDNCNAGIQFRSKKANASGQAIGYQADVGTGVWGKLYHEHGRGKLDWNDRALKAVKRGDWNHYEILAVGHRIWTAINGTLCVALEDPQGELSGKISFQIHGGPAQTVRYRVVKLVHNPKVALEKQTKEQLLAALPKKAVVKEDKPEKKEPAKKKKPPPKKVVSIFEDKNLERAVRKQVFAKRDNEAPLTAEDVRRISSVKGKEFGIKSLKGLEHCKELASLELPGNQINDLSPLKGLTRLQLIDLSGNKVADTSPLQDLGILQYLNLENNQVANLKPIGSIPSLRSLYLTGNQITDTAPLTKLIKLWSLYLGDNKIKDITPLKTLLHLDILDIRNNQVADIGPIANHNAFRMLFLQGNKVQNLGPLLANVKKDAAGRREFSPFLRVWLKGNPVPKGQVAELKKLVKEVQ